MCWLGHKFYCLKKNKCNVKNWKIYKKKLTLGSLKLVGANFVDCLNFTDPWFHSIIIVFLKVFVLCYLFQRAVLLVIWSFSITCIKVLICDVIVNCMLKVAQLKVSGKPKRLSFLFHSGCFLERTFLINRLFLLCKFMIMPEN